ncbi:MAG: LysM peptidoglycan-binding domain-containing protein [Leptolyngbya sp. SIO3F4]|nr:LysM peptidoglycan-binding domain-containing protein [Leptolyngbya sp. SIO3F4]
MDTDKLLVFFFGSPAEGFTSYPENYLSLVHGLDRSSSEYYRECQYAVNQDGSRIQYIEYGLTGIGKNNTSRGGRNFGIWIQLEDFKISEHNQTQILPFLEEFITKGIVENTSIFKVDSTGRKHFQIDSFSEVSRDIDQLIEAFKENFIHDFHHKVEKVSIIDNKSTELIINKKNKSTSYGLQTSFTKNEAESIEFENTKQKEIYANSQLPAITKINTVFIIIILIALVYNLNLSFKNRSIIERISQNLTKDSKVHLPEEQIIDTPSKPHAQQGHGNLNRDTHTVKKGETLREIVINYNEKNNTQFDTDSIAMLNNIDDISKINVGQVIYFP